MKPKNFKITTLTEDIQQILKTTYGDKLELIRLCRDHTNPYLLKDKKAILNITQDEFVGIFDLNSNHYFLSPEQVLRFGIFCKLDLPNIIALILKAEWENHLAEVLGYTLKNKVRLGPILVDNEMIEKNINLFKPNTGAYFSLIKNLSSDFKSNISFTKVDFFVRDLLSGKNFLNENLQIAKLYSHKGNTEKTLLHGLQESEREHYLRLKEIWKIKSTELDELLLLLERKKKINLNIENKYYKIFGKLEIQKARFWHRLVRYREILKMMFDYPELSYRQIIKRANAKMSEFDKEKEELKVKIARSLFQIEDYVPEGSFSTMSAAFKNTYMQQCKKLLRKIFFLLHMDTCPNYDGLSKQKKSEVDELWLQLMKSTKNELYSTSPTMLLYSLPNYDQLLSIYMRACEILDINPEDFELGNRLEFMIENGASFETIMEFLKSETERLEIHLAQLELVSDDYTNEEQCQQYRSAIDEINIHNEKLKKQISELKKDIARIKVEISNNLKKVVNNAE